MSLWRSSTVFRHTQNIRLTQIDSSKNIVRRCERL